MKKLLLPILALFLIMSCVASKQKSNKLEVNEVDEYTGNKIKKTYWQNLSKDRSYSYFRFRKVNDQYYLHFKTITGDVFAVDEGENLYFKFSDGSIMKMYNPVYKITNYGDGSINIVGSEALGIHLNMRISKEKLELLSSKQLTGYRIIGTEGYREREVSNKYSQNVNRLATLILNHQNEISSNEK